MIYLMIIVSVVNHQNPKNAKAPRILPKLTVKFNLTQSAKPTTTVLHQEIQLSKVNS